MVFSPGDIDWEGGQETFWSEGNALHLDLGEVHTWKQSLGCALFCLTWVIFQKAPLSAEWGGVLPEVKGMLKTGTFTHQESPWPGCSGLNPGVDSVWASDKKGLREHFFSHYPSLGDEPQAQGAGGTHPAHLAAVRGRNQVLAPHQQAFDWQGTVTKENWHLRQLWQPLWSLVSLSIEWGWWLKKTGPNSRGLSRKCNEVWKSAWAPQRYISQVETSCGTVFQKMGSREAQPSRWFWLLTYIDLAEDVPPRDGGHSPGAPKICLCEVSESMGPERKYWPLSGPLGTQIVSSTGTSDFQLTKYTYKPILSENAYY